MSTLTRYLAISVLACLFSFAQAEKAFAESHLVKIKQLNVLGETQSIICKDNQQCFLPMSLVSPRHKSAPIIIETSFVPGNVIFKFRTINGYFYAGGKRGASKTNWYTGLDRDGHAKGVVTLYLPIMPRAEANSLYQLPVENITYNAIADLEITIEPSP